MRKFFAIAAIHIIFLSTLSYYSNPLIADSSGLVNTGNNYMISMPSAYGNKLLWTECINDKFVLRSNFGFEYDKENVFYPVLSDSGYVLFETIENKIPLQKSIDINMGILLDRAEIKLNDGSYNKDKTKRVYSAEGILYIEDLQTGEKHHLTKGKQMCYFPVFADSDSSVIFCSDRNRGVSFTALYKMKIK